MEEIKRERSIPRRMEASKKAPMAPIAVKSMIKKKRIGEMVNMPALKLFCGSIKKM